MARLVPSEVVLRRGERITVRSAEASDAAAVISLIRDELNTHEFSVTQPDEFDKTEEEQAQTLEDFADRPGALFLLAEHGGTLIANLSFKNHPRRRMAHHGHFGIGVSEPWRGRGVGRALITTLLDWAAASQDVEKVCLGVFANNAAAIGLYTSIGFAEEGRRSREFKLGPGRYTDDIQMSIWVKPVEGAFPRWRANNPPGGADARGR
jgi:RimJ/RimL family protein N-acetyltransferase